MLRANINIEALRSCESKPFLYNEVLKQHWPFHSFT